MIALIVIVSILGPGSAPAGNPSGAVALNVLEIGRFEDQTGCVEAIKNAHIEQKAVFSGASVPSVQYQFMCIDRGKG